MSPFIESKSLQIYTKIYDNDSLNQPKTRNQVATEHRVLLPEIHHPALACVSQIIAELLFEALDMSTSKITVGSFFTTCFGPFLYISLSGLCIG